uniref:Gasdermin pore forming domain-containing protein n=1 Tax=Moschus moschiferus TaxID=68415 RepID=A0A8C6E5J2_MOSMO
MSSFFSRDSKSLVRELGQKGDSLASTLRLRPFCLVRKKHRCPLWPRDTPFVSTDFSLVDALEPGSPIPELSCSEPICFQEAVAGAVTGGVSLGTGQQGKATGSGAVSRSSMLAVWMLRVPPYTWETLVEERKLRTPRPSFLQELQSRKEKESLYEVTEAMEACKT